MTISWLNAFFNCSHVAVESGWFLAQAFNIARHCLYTLPLLSISIWEIWPTVDQTPSTLLRSCLPTFWCQHLLFLLVVGYLQEAFPSYRKKNTLQVSLTNERLIFNLKAESNPILWWSQSTILMPHLKDLGQQATIIDKNQWQWLTNLHF